MDLSQLDNVQSVDDTQEHVLVFLKKAFASTNDLADLSNDHINFLNKQVHKGKLLLAGPLLDESEFKTICIYNCSIEETISIAMQDPAVQSGDLDFEVHPWYGRIFFGTQKKNSKTFQHL